MRLVSWQKRKRGTTLHLCCSPSSSYLFITGWFKKKFCWLLKLLPCWTMFTLQVEHWGRPASCYWICPKLGLKPDASHCILLLLVFDVFCIAVFLLYLFTFQAKGLPIHNSFLIPFISNLLAHFTVRFSMCYLVVFNCFWLFLLLVFLLYCIILMFLVFFFISILCYCLQSLKHVRLQFLEWNVLFKYICLALPFSSARPSILF